MSQSATSGRSSRWIMWVAVGAALLVGGVGGGVIGSATASTASPTSTASASAGTVSACPVSNVADQVLPSVVTISAQGSGGGGTGSGEVINPDGYILTNNHVIAAAANGGKVEVLFSDGATAPATITGRDPLTDLAVIKVSDQKHLKAIRLGSSSSVHLGQPVVALGAPLGLSGTVTAGIVSAQDRTVEVPGENNQSALLLGAVQTDAAINPGNSGGALVNCSGQLIGVPSAGASVPSSSGETTGGNIGLGFAIPVDLAKSVSSELISTGRVSHAYFGLQATPVPPESAAQAGVPEGLFVSAVAANGPAARAGLRQGDVITSIDGKPATSNVQIQELTLTKKPGDQVKIEYQRAGQKAAVTVTLEAQP